MIFELFGFSKKIRKNPKNCQFLGQKRQKSVKITKKEKKLGKNSMQKFPNLSVKTVKKLGPKKAKTDKKSSKNFTICRSKPSKNWVQNHPKGEKIVQKISQFVGQNCQKSGSERDQN